MNKKMEFPNYKVFETEFAGRPLKVETGKMTQLANGACLVSYGETVVHVAVTASAKPRFSSSKPRTTDRMPTKNSA